MWRPAVGTAAEPTSSPGVGAEPKEEELDPEELLPRFVGAPSSPEETRSVRRAKEDRECIGGL